METRYYIEENERIVFEATPKEIAYNARAYAENNFNEGFKNNSTKIRMDILHNLSDTIRSRNKTLQKAIKEDQLDPFLKKTYKRVYAEISNKINIAKQNGLLHNTNAEIQAFLDEFKKEIFDINGSYWTGIGNLSCTFLPGTAGNELKLKILADPFTSSNPKKGFFPEETHFSLPNAPSIYVEPVFDAPAITFEEAALYLQKKFEEETDFSPEKIQEYYDEFCKYENLVNSANIEEYKEQEPTTHSIPMAENFSLSGGIDAELIAYEHSLPPQATSQIDLFESSSYDNDYRNSNHFSPNSPHFFNKHHHSEFTGDNSANDLQFGDIQIYPNNLGG